MGYCASGGGDITFKRFLSDDAIKMIEEKLYEWFDDVQYCKTYQQQHSFAVSKWYDKYYDDVLDALTEIALNWEVSSGEIEYSGEDGYRWRFIFQDGAWKEENADFYYESSLIAKKERAFDSIVKKFDWDMIVVELKSAGFTQDEIEEIKKESFHNGELLRNDKK